MCHQPDVIRVVVADIAEPQGKVIALKQALETGPPTVEGMSAGIDNFCIGQDQMDQTDVKEIAKRLVGKKRPPRRAADSGDLQILFSDRAEIGIRKAIEDFDIGVHQSALFDGVSVGEFLKTNL